MWTFARGEAYWKIADNQEGQPWIQATIRLVGTGNLTPPEGNIDTDLREFGEVHVGGSSIDYEFLDDGGIFVDGWLMTLDGPVQVDAETFPGPIVQFTVSEYVDPGEVFRTYTDNRRTLDRIVWTIGDDYVEGGVVGSTSAQSTSLKAFVGGQ